MDRRDLQIIESDDGIIADVRSMIEQTREGVARTVNAGMTLLYWRIGKRIQTEILQQERAEYGKKIVQSQSAQLTSEFGRGFGCTALTRMVRFFKLFSEAEIIATLSQQLASKFLRFSRSPRLPNRDAVPSRSPRLAQRAYPGATNPKSHQPQGRDVLSNAIAGRGTSNTLGADSHQPSLLTQPLWGNIHHGTIPLGGRFPASLGFGTAPLWDKEKGETE